MADVVLQFLPRRIPDALHLASNNSSLPRALLCGYWRPTNWPTHSLKYWIYNIYSAFMILLLNFFTFCTCVDALISEDLKMMTDKFSLCISVLGVCLKMANLFLQRGNIISVMNILLKKNCVPRDEEERMIQKKNDDYARKLTIYCEILNESTVFFATLAQYHVLIRTRTLPVSDWMPCDLSSQVLYMISLVYQTIGLIVCANTSVANETLIAGLMIQAGAQFDIFCHRARNLSTSLMEANWNSESRDDANMKRKKILSNLVDHHLEIYEFAETVNRVFQYMILLQLIISSTVLCLSIYKLSTVDLFSGNFVWSGFYLCCMLMQVYLYCWFGNEVTLKSSKVSEAIYEMDWTILPTDITKDLLLIVARSARPVKMTSAHVVVLSSQSFMSIMKITYSSYNILSNSAIK